MKTYWVTAEKQLLAQLREQGKGNFKTVNEAITAGACTELDWCKALDTARQPISSEQISRNYRAEVLQALQQRPQHSATSSDLLNNLGISRAAFYNVVKMLKSSQLIRVTPGKNGHYPQPMIIELVQP